MSINNFNPQNLRHGTNEVLLKERFRLLMIEGVAPIEIKNLLGITTKQYINWVNDTMFCTWVSMEERLLYQLNKESRKETPNANNVYMLATSLQIVSDTIQGKRHSAKRLLKILTDHTAKTGKHGKRSV